MKTAFRPSLHRILLVAGCIALGALLSSQPAPRERVGPLPGGGFLLNSFWKLDPAGRQIPLDTFPMASALSPDGKYLVILNGGYKPPSLSVIDVSAGNVVSTTPVADGWLGLAFAPGTNRLYVGGGSRASVFEFTLADGNLSPGRTFEIVPKASRAQHDFVGDVAFSPDGRMLYAAELYNDTVAVVNPQSGMVVSHFKTGRRPYRILFHPDGKSFFVSHWADGNIGHYDTASGNLIVKVPIGQHPTDMVWRNGASDGAPGEPQWIARLFVAAANTNNVYTVGVNEAGTLTVIETINLSMTAQQPLGMTPSALALSPDGKRMYVACSDGNVAGVVDVSGTRSRVEGFIPTGWYPTAVRVLPSGTLVVLNGKGLGSHANPNGPNPLQKAAPVHEGIRQDQYVGQIQTGTASWIAPFPLSQLETWTHKALADSAYNDDKLDQPSALPPIQHVLYIVRENRTYDQVLGDLKEGNGDPNLVLFGENVTPNLHKLAREFVLLDNFYVNADVSADGHNWSTAAIAPDYVVKMWPNEYAHRRTTYDFEEQDPASLPPAGYLWTAAGQSGLSIRNFGYMANNDPKNPPPGAEQITKVRDPVLAKVTNRFYRGFDLAYPDRERAKTFIAELKDYEQKGAMPQLMVMRLGNDHTYGVQAGRLTPLALAADNDYALGMIVEAISKSKFWGSTLICVLEDDAQNGADHVDSHRSPAFLISSFVKRHAVDGTMYNTTSMLRTIELILGLRPMTQFDAAARPMSASFQKAADLAPYTAEQPRVSLTDKNPADTPAAKEMADMKFDEADENDDDKLNDVLWRAIRKNSPPPPVRSYFGK
ncbi:MAG: bifunctional YncE family protein/alkaline phosphatase family protein [Candidatus Sulfopaludibacter sp.]|nr:bifunctional YncE family protein/alkaline phosphatase family protein [Candidatus Sulfopaludibacter sp.]